MRGQRAFVMAVVAVVLAVGPGSSQEYLKVVPDDALGIVVVNRLAQTSGKLQTLGKKMNLPPVDALAMVKMILGVDKGLDEKGTIVVAILPGELPIPLIYVPVSDYKQFVTQLKPKDAAAEIAEVRTGDTQSLVGKKGNYAVFAESKSRAALKKALGSTKDLSTAAAAARAFLEANDTALLITSAGVKAAAAQMRPALQKAKADIANAPPEARFALGWIDTLETCLKTSEAEVTHLVLGIQYLDQGGNLSVSSRALFAANGSIAKWSATFKAPEGGVLVGLPATPFVLAGGGSFSEETMKSLMDFSLQMIKATAKELSADNAKKLEQAYGAMAKGIRAMSYLLAPGKQGEGIFDSTYGVLKVDNAAAYLENYEKSLQTMNAVLKETKLPLLPTYAAKKVKVAGLAGLEMTTDLLSVMPGGGGPMEKKMMELIFGPGGKMTITLVAADNSTILMRYTAADKSADMVQAYKKGGGSLAADADLAKTTAALPVGAQWAMYLSPQGSLEFANRLIAAAGLPLTLPAFPRTPPIGMAVKFSATSGETQLVVPGAVLEGIGSLVQKLRGDM